METQNAGFWWRFLAYLIDRVIVGVASSFITIPILGAMGISAFGFANSFDSTSAESLGFALAVIGVYFFVALLMVMLEWLYYALMESSKHQGTLGKLALGITVTDMSGNRISFGRATARYFCKILSAMVFCIGYIIAGFTKEKQALHDLIASTLVKKSR